MLAFNTAISVAPSLIVIAPAAVSPNTREWRTAGLEDTVVVAAVEIYVGL